MNCHTYSEPEEAESRRASGVEPRGQLAEPTAGGLGVHDSSPVGRNRRLSQLDADPSSVTRRLTEAVEARELAAVRESKRIEGSDAQTTPRS